MGRPYDRKPKKIKLQPDPADSQDMFQQAVKVLGSHPECISLHDVVSYLPCSYSQFLRLMTSCKLFMDELEMLLEKNKNKQKMKLRKFWGTTKAAPMLQKSLYQLLSDEEELRKLSGKSLTELETLKQQENKIIINNTPVPVPVVEKNTGDEDAKKDKS